MKIRRLEPKDAATAVVVVKLFAAQDVSVEYMERFLANPINHLIIAEVGEEVTGFILTHTLQRMK